MNRPTHALGQGLLAFWHAARREAENGNRVASALPATVRAALERAPGTQRGIAITAMLLVLPLILGESNTTWPGVWIALQVGGGTTLMALPSVIGWSQAAIGRFAALMLGAGFFAVIGLTTALPDDPAQAQTLRQAVLISSAIAACLSLSMVLITQRLGRILGTFALPLSAALAIASGATLFVLGVTAWQTGDTLVRLMAIVGGLWVAAFLCNRFEATRGFRSAGRLLALRNGTIRLGGLLSGAALAQIAVPWLETTAWRVALNTPLEGIAPIAGMLAGMGCGLAVAGAGMTLPALLARWQLGARISASTAGEVAWFAAWMLLMSNAVWLDEAVAALLNALGREGVFLHAIPVDFGPRNEAAAQVALACLVVLVHGVARILLGRPAHSPGTPLWLVLPSDAEFTEGLHIAERVATEWNDGPVTLLAPSAAAPRLRGTHLRLTQYADSVADLFLNTAMDAKAWQHQPMAEATRGALHLREVYATPAAAQALMTLLPDDARVLALADGPMAEGWTAALAELPEHSERFSLRTATLDKPIDASWKEGPDREHLITGFFLKHRPRPIKERRILILHCASDSALAEALAATLNTQSDTHGQRVAASLLQPATSGTAALAWSVATWLTLLALFNRFAKQGGLGGLGRLIWRFLPAPETRARTQRFDLIVIEAGMNPTESAAARGLERMVDSVIGLTPAIRAHDAPTLYASNEYTARISLPAPSALADALPALTRQLIDIEARPRYSDHPDSKGGTHPGKTRSAAESKNTVNTLFDDSPGESDVPTERTEQSATIPMPEPSTPEDSATSRQSLGWLKTALPASFMLWRLLRKWFKRSDSN
ncbi:hypothetical protein [Denitromonas ohlonensis]|uniref:Uncharacterized protein n=2 Tax=Denitromonas TaxID=139331 RepID=A0A557RLG9_9RHOO|nr:hypothetical protein [Denitromonas ohlonensis]TVO66021.1 hypothetical protein FHP90_11190 [Denitromonas ohlonensis]TVO79614.1 hypothetical protein FHP89_02375 [Denitromonas ohlonensis]